MNVLVYIAIHRLIGGFQKMSVARIGRFSVVNASFSSHFNGMIKHRELPDEEFIPIPSNNYNGLTPTANAVDSEDWSEGGVNWRANE